MAALVGIAGGTGSGKSTLATRLWRVLGPEACALVTQDSYYRDLAKFPYEERGKVNFDHPEAIDAQLLSTQLKALKAGEPVERPVYDFSRHIRSSGGEILEPAPVIIVEGILVLVWPEVAELLDVAIYVDTPADIRLARRVRRDIRERGRAVEGVLDQYLSTVRAMHELYVEPTRSKADLIVPGFGDNRVIVDTLARSLRSLAREHSERLV